MGFAVIGEDAGQVPGAWGELIRKEQGVGMASAHETLRQSDAVIFDLDGTLWDTCESCAVAWNRVLQRHQIAFREIVAADVRGVTGRPHAECIATVFDGVSEADLDVLTRETMTEDNIVVAERGGELYDGMVAGVRALSRTQPLMIVSNCQSGYIETFLAFSGLGDCFTDFECWGNTGESKAENLRQIIARNRLQAPVYVGDTVGDYDAAHANGIPFVFAQYGFGDACGAEITVRDFAELLDYLTV